jgi:uncharacterized protein with PQ loop repeat
VSLEDAVSVVAVALTVVFAWPQVFRALKHGVHGVSPGAITQSMIAASAWLGYGIARDLTPVLVANIGVASGQLVVTIELVRNGVVPRSRAALAIAGAVALIGLSQLDVLTEPIVAVAGLMACTSVLTQLLEVRREPHRLEGLSASTYALLTGMSAAWFVYGVLLGDAVIIATNAVAFPMAAYIAWAASRSHHEVEDASDPLRH